MIDYLNFVKPRDAAYRHDTGTNVKQLQAWRKLYKESTATAPSCWPGKIKHDGHTISVSDVWFIGHHLGKMSTLVGHLDHLEEGRVHLSDGTTLEADVVVGCIGFERNTTFCEQLTGRTVVRHSNYLDKNMMYLAGPNPNTDHSPNPSPNPNPKPNPNPNPNPNPKHDVPRRRRD